ncbi:MAG: hypothetical protein KBE41_06080 [Lutibacter sp.]|nr:hypothetical protein [Lutibacter sp.]MBP9601050.1 hypothetical protein [Lutibacter sp.]
MKNFKLLFIGLILTLNLSAQGSRRAMHLTGKIADNIPIKMTLTFQGNDVLGYYYYEKYHRNILVEGKLNGTTISLNEIPDYENEFNMGFKGAISGSSFSGEWIDKNKKKASHFNLKVDSDKKLLVDSKTASLEGVYKNVNSSATFQSSIRLQNISHELFFFEISNGTKSGCIGYLKGLIALNDLKKGVFAGDSCDELAFQIINKKIILTEKSCDLHGMSCPFEGTYNYVEKP